MKAFVVSFALLCHDARARERETDRQRDRETHLHSSVMMRFVSSQNARGVKNIIIEREDDEKKMIERNDGQTSPMEYNYPSRVFVSKRDRETERQKS